MIRTILRVAHRERFTIIDTRLFENACLSWAARGVLAYLLSRPDDWRVIVKDIQRRGDLGRDGVYALLCELRHAGYVHFKRLREPGGVMSKGLYLITEEPHSLHPAWPEEVRPDLAQPDPVKPQA